MKLKLKKPIIIFSSIILVLALFILAFLIFTLIYAKNNVNDSFDELLFSSAKGSSITRYYVNVGNEKYIPELIESASMANGEKLWYEIDEIPEYLKNAFICAEDRKFYSHHGVDLRRTLLAGLNTMFHFDNNFGASTITQQVIKNISGDSEVSVKRKFTEIIRALKLESRHNKDEILELYMNIAPMGENLLGVGSAAHTYFGKAPSELSISEAATLVGITNAPTRYNPHDNPDACLKKRNDVLYTMQICDKITEEEYRAALNEPLSVEEKVPVENKINSWFIETVNEDVVKYLTENCNISSDIAKKMIYSGGLNIYTTMDKEVQDTLEKYFEDESNFPKEISGGLDFSAVICDSQNGDMLGIVGSTGKKKGNMLLNMALVPHTPGSSLKPLALYAPLINEGKIRASDVFDDVPVDFIRYKAYPKNYPARYDGLTTVKDALRLSKNTVAVRLYNMMGAEKIYKHLKSDYGFDTLVRRYITENGEVLSDLAPSPLALGQLSYGVSLRALTEAYTVFPAEGKLNKGRSFVAVYDSEGKLLIDNSKKSDTVYSPTAARIMNKLLMNVVDNGTASSITLKNTVDTAGKTGTSGDDKDRLFVGYTPYYTMGIWCGYRNGNSEIGRIAPTHLKIWDNIMTEVHKEKLKNIPDNKIENFSDRGLIKCEYCKDSGMLCTTTCDLDARGCRREVGYFTRDNMPKKYCDRHIPVYYDIVNGGVASRDCPPENLEVVALISAPTRSFPYQIAVTDAEYVYREMIEGYPYGDSDDVPYFIYQISDGEYVGKSKSKKQFNSYCRCHTK